MHHHNITVKTMDTDIKILDIQPTKRVVPVEADQIPVRILKAGMIVVGRDTVVDGMLYDLGTAKSMVINLRTKAM